MERAAAAQVGRMEIQITAAVVSVYLDKELVVQGQGLEGLEEHLQQPELVELTAVAAAVHIHVPQATAA